MERTTSLNPRSHKGVDPRLLRRLPAFSPSAVRLLPVLADERASFKEIARLVGLDPVLAGKVLQLANSGLYGRRYEVRSILQAIAMLGIGSLSQIVITAALWSGLPRHAAPFVQDWWRHSIAAALVARRSAKDFSPDFAYTAALLHGVGQLALFADVPQDYPSLLDRAYAGELDLLAVECDDLGVDHASLAGLLLESWGLPEKLCEAAAKHHDAGTDEPLVLAVQVGCAGAEYAGFGRCGCHDGFVMGVSRPLVELFGGEYAPDTLTAEVNQIECSLA